MANDEGSFHVLAPPVYHLFFFFFLMVVGGTQGFALAKQALYH
jgi:hypothetical protein